MSGGTSAAAATATLGSVAADTALATGVGIASTTGVATSTALSAGALAGYGGMSLGTLGMIGSVASGLMGAMGANNTAAAQEAAARYQSEIAGNNAIIAKQNATWAGQAGGQQVEQKQMQTRAKVGAIMASQGANGLDVNSGSAPAVRISASDAGRQDALNIASNAARTAYGYQAQATSYQDQAGLYAMEAANAPAAGVIGETSSLLGGLSSAGNMYTNWQSKNSVNPLSQGY